MSNKAPYTSCKECAFAEYNGNTQTGCSLDKLKDFEDVIEAYDDEKEFYVIQNRFCYYARTKQWAEKYEDTLEQLEKEMQHLPYQVIIFASSNLEKLSKTLDSVYKLDILPAHISIINKKIKDPQLIVDDIESREPKIRWYLKGIRNANLSNHKCIDQIIKFIRQPFYAVFHSGFEIPRDLFSALRDKIYHDNLQFAFIKPNTEGNGEIVSSSMHMALNGNQAIGLEKKIESQECPNLIKTIHEIMPNFPA